MVMNTSYRDLIQWPIYIINGNLDVKIRRFQKQLRILIQSSIFIVHKLLEDTNNRDKYLKTKIYHVDFKIIL